MTLDFKATPLDRDIARHAAAFIPDEAVLECGIGSLPNAVLAALFAVAQLYSSMYLAVLFMWQMLAMSALAIALGRFLPDAGKLMTILHSGLIVAAYGAVLVVSRELNKSDLANLKAIVTRKKRGA